MNVPVSQHHLTRHAHAGTAADRRRHHTPGPGHGQTEGGQDKVEGTKELETQRQEEERVRRKEEEEAAKREAEKMARAAREAGLPVAPHLSAVSCVCCMCECGVGVGVGVGVRP